MSIFHSQGATEVILSQYKEKHWYRRDAERITWVQTPKIRKKSKALKCLNEDYVDQELYPALQLLNQMGIITEYSCAGVSILDEPEDHSLYAYVTLPETHASTLFVQYMMKRMRHRLIVTYEPARQRFDLSSFFIKHNRSFCMSLYLFALEWHEVDWDKRTQG
jgi:hypothetical protein